MRPWRIVFMGTPDFSVPALKALKEAGHEIDHLNGILFIEKAKNIRKVTEA